MNYGQRTCVVVLGMHRSGTSVLAATLQALGVSFGNRLIAPGPDNPKGYVENVDLLHANIALLESFGLDRDGLLGELPVDWLTDPKTETFKKEIRAIIVEQFADAYIFGFKDPRISILLPAYLEVLSDLGISVRCVVAVRSIAEVAASLAKRNSFSFYKSIRAYQYYYRMIDMYTQSVSTVRVAYSDLLSRTQDVVMQLGRAVHPSLRPYAEVAPVLEQVIDLSLQHHVATEHEVLRELALQVEQLQEELEQLRRAREQDIIWWQQRVDTLTELSREQVTAFTEQSRQQIETFEQTIQEQAGVVRKAHADRDDAKRAYTELSQSYKELEDALGYLERTYETFKHTTHVAHLKAEKHKTYLEQVLQERDTHITELNTTIANIERSFVWKMVKGWDFMLAYILPKDTPVRRFYDAIIARNQHILNDWLPKHVVRQLQRARIEQPSREASFWQTFHAAHPKVEVLFINHEESRTGAPRIVFDVASHAKKQWNVAMVSLAGGSMHKTFTETFGQVIYPTELYPHMSEHEQARLILEQVQPTVVYANSIGTHHFARVAKELGIRVIFHVHELDIAFRIVFSKRQRAHINELADAFIAVSQPVYDLLVGKLGCDESKVHLLHAFVDRERIAQQSQAIPIAHVQSELKQQPGEVLVLGLGMFIYRKGADIFMHVAKKLHERGLPCKFVWIGSRPFKEPFMADFATYAPYFSLLQEKENPFPYLAAADIFVLPSREDPFPLVTLEAMSLGKPVVVFKEAGGIKDAVQDAGIVVDSFDVDAFADAVETLVCDHVERQVLGSRGALRQLPYDSSAALPRIMDLIDEALTCN